MAAWMDKGPHQRHILQSRPPGCRKSIAEGGKWEEEVETRGESLNVASVLNVVVGRSPAAWMSSEGLIGQIRSRRQELAPRSWVTQIGLRGCRIG